MDIKNIYMFFVLLYFHTQMHSCFQTYFYIHYFQLYYIVYYIFVRLKRPNFPHTEKNFA